MSLLAALVLAAATARVESVSLTTRDSRLAVRVRVSGTPGLVAVHREGEVARVSIMDADLGMRFAGARRLSWTPSDGFDPALLAATPAKLDRLEVAASASEVSVLLHVPPEVSVDVRRDSRGLLLVFRDAGAPAEPVRVARSTPVAEPAVVVPPPVVPEPSPAAPQRVESAPPAPVESLAAAPAVAQVAPSTPPPAAPPADTADLAKRLFPTAPDEAQGEAPAATTGDVADLYPRLFPTAAPQAQAEETLPPPEVVEPGQDAGVALGPFRVRASIAARYMNADTFVESTAVPTKASYLAVQPRVDAVAPVGEGHFTLDYLPVFRGFSDYDQINSSSQSLTASLDLPVGWRVNFNVWDRFQAGILDTRVVDPGGEYFFGLGHFRRNDVNAGASIAVGPRLSVELGGALGQVRFQEPADFFPYDTRSASAGFGFELTPNLKAVASYVYDAVPRPAPRPEAELTANSARLSLGGEILPLLTGDLSVGYRSQGTPNAGPGGTSYSGFVMSAALTRQLGRSSSLGLYASRTTPVSNYEENGFYISNSVQGTLQLPLFAQVELQGGVGYQWNDYRTVATEIGSPRQDRILGWYAGLRRPIRQNLFLSGAYRSEDRRSNLDAFDTTADGFYFQLEWDIFGSPSR
ncbi:MAG TPA: outer membrane beta-barrel protein [Vicinamibacteria bacterium]|nr:outer membrane beta-barrel protein [Vicinamibacteria bacterium]